MAKRYFSEEVNPHFGYFYTIGKILKRKRTKFQKLELMETPEFGRVLTLDNITQVADKGEYQYHEPLVHPAFVTHPDPQDVLVIGGGDGGTLREALRHKTVKRAVMAELDEDVVRFCDKFMPEISAGAFSDKRTELLFDDGRKYIENSPKTFDAIAMDMTDPFGPSIMLYTREFFQAVKRSFKDKNGVFSMHVESPITRPRVFATIYKTLTSVFKYVRVFYIYIQMYSTFWAVGVCSDKCDAAKLKAADVDRILKKRGIHGLMVYTGATHESMQVEFPYITQTRARKVDIITDKNAMSQAVNIRRHDLFAVSKNRKRK